MTATASAEVLVEWPCPKCPLVIRVRHPNTLAIDKALHLKRHELRGD